MAHERICIVDGAKYKYCSHCNQYNPQETWRYLFCGDNCRKVWDILESYRAKKIDVYDAKSKLKQCDLTTLSNAKGALKRDLEEILLTEEKIEEVKNVEETLDIQEVPETIEEAVTVIEEPNQKIEKTETVKMKKKSKTVVLDEE